MTRRRWKPSSHKKPLGKAARDGVCVRSSYGPFVSGVVCFFASTDFCQKFAVVSACIAFFDVSTLAVPVKYPRPPSRLENVLREKAWCRTVAKGVLGRKIASKFLAKDVRVVSRLAVRPAAGTR
jgi:hypothetical protein